MNTKPETLNQIYCIYFSIIFIFWHITIRFPPLTIIVVNLLHPLNWRSRKRNFEQSIYLYIYIKLEDIANYLPCGIYGNVFRPIRVILLGQTTPRARICHPTWTNNTTCQNFIGKVIVTYQYFIIITKYFMTFLNYSWINLKGI